MRARAKTAAALCGLLSGLSSCGEPQVDSLGQPPVVLIVFDALSASHIGHLGYERDTTPVLDALAAEGVSFASAFAPAPYTLASIPSLHTGRLPDHHGLTNKIAVLPEDESTLAELLGARGYWSAAAVSNLNGSSTYGLDQGFDEFVELFHVQAGEDAEHTDFAGREFRIPRAPDFVAQAASYLEARPADRPPFLYLHFLEPHSPYQPPEPYRSRWIDPAYQGPFAEGETEPLVGSTRPEDHDAYVSVLPDDEEAARDLYDANLAWGDAALARCSTCCAPRACTTKP